jgi:hypothetical protein
VAEEIGIGPDTGFSVFIEEIGIGPDTGFSVFIAHRRRCGHHWQGREGVQLRRAVGRWQLLLRGGAGSDMQRGSSSVKNR